MDRVLICVILKYIHDGRLNRRGIMWKKLHEPLSSCTSSYVTDLLSPYRDDGDVILTDEYTDTGIV